MAVSKSVTVGMMAVTAAVGTTVAAKADGAYMGLSLGQFNGALPFKGDQSNTNYSVGNDLSFGAFAGYNWDLASPAVAGIEVALSKGPSSNYQAPTYEDYAINYLVDVKGRIGAKIGQNAFAYAFAGASRGNMGTLALGDYGVFGANFGVGGEYAINEKMSVGIEYIDRRLRDVSGVGGTVDLSSVSVRAIFKF